MTVTLAAPKKMIELSVDGEAVRVFEGSTILDACRRLGIETPTLDAIESICVSLAEAKGLYSP